ncbi:PFL_4695 family integrating conjugative element protein [Methylotuvimicrobium sp. KM1]|uniref:PFL_4695 family integrating conjugative element protein n=1 Tax=Methylotuvimicrobium sp. KM1 TaxID=3377707 RepID=UPI00384C7C70
MRCVTVCFILIALFSTAANSEPVVLFDAGNTQPMPDRVQISPPNYQQSLRLPDIPQNVDPLPVLSQALTPGPVQSRVIDRPGLDRPVFIVGYDELSLKWLRHNLEPLKRHRATGIVVNVENQDQLRQLRQAAEGLEVNPVPGDKIARKLELTHYPVLISKNRIEQ